MVAKNSTRMNVKYNFVFIIVKLGNRTSTDVNMMFCKCQGRIILGFFDLEGWFSNYNYWSWIMRVNVSWNSDYLKLR